jgi:hypothetical protein
LKTHCFFAVALCLAVTACKKDEPSPSPAASAAAPASASAAPKAAPEKPWFAGAWSGTYAAERFAIELPIGNVPAWKKDDGSKASGAGKISLDVSPEGTVSGSADGPLGKHVARGSVEADTLRVEFVPEGTGADTFRGVMLVTREGDAAKGELRASSGDSLTVRRANVTLAKAP